MSSLHTSHGSPIKRYKNIVGKDIGGAIYVHRLYAEEVIPADLLAMYVSHLPNSFKYNTVVFNRREGTIRFDEALGFDVVREPWAGNYVKVTPLLTLVMGKTESIWHHKWLWVKEDYKGFDVQKSYEWSKKWLDRLHEPASGSMKTWQQQLKEVGLGL